MVPKHALHLAYILLAITFVPNTAAGQTPAAPPRPAPARPAAPAIGAAEIVSLQGTGQARIDEAQAWGGAVGRVRNASSIHEGPPFLIC